MCFKVFHSSLEIISQRETVRTQSECIWRIVRSHLAYSSFREAEDGAIHVQSRRLGVLLRHGAFAVLAVLSILHHCVRLVCFYCLCVGVWCGANDDQTHYFTFPRPPSSLRSVLLPMPNQLGGILQIPNQLNLTTGVKNTRHTNQRKIFPAVSFTTGNITIDALFYTPNF